MAQGADRRWLRAELAEPITQLRRFGWTVEHGYVSQISQEFSHARYASLEGLDESLVAARFGDDGRLFLERFALPHGVSEWIQCDEDAFLGFLDDGVTGLDDGRHFTRATYCTCGKKIHRSVARGEAFARKVAKEAGSDGIQKSYRCVQNPRAAHLSSKDKGKAIPGAFVVLAEGWNAR